MTRGRSLLGTGGRIPSECVCACCLHQELVVVNIMREGGGKS